MKLERERGFPKRKSIHRGNYIVDKWFAMRNTHSETVLKVASLGTARDFVA